jgi:hypothetical protein
MDELLDLFAFAFSHPFLVMALSYEKTFYNVLSLCELVSRDHTTQILNYYFVIFILFYIYIYIYIYNFKLFCYLDVKNKKIKIILIYF